MEGVLQGLSQIYDTRSNQGGPRSPNFKHRQTGELQWMDRGHNPLWFQEELRRSRVKDRESCVQKVKDEAHQVDFYTQEAGRKGATAHTVHQELRAEGEDDATRVLHQEFQNPIGLLDLIKACGKHRDLPEGSKVHALILKRGLLTKDIYVGTALLSMYAKCGALAKAQEVFDELPARDVAAWNALITAYSQHGLGHEALDRFAWMRDEGFFPDAVTFVCILKACGSIGATEKGEEIHAEVRRQGLLEKNIVLGTALVDMYARCGVLAKAQEVFDELPIQNVVSWNALITGYAQHGLGYEAVNCFAQMRDRGLSPDPITFVGILKACGSIGATEKGEEIHAEVGKQGLLGKNIVLGTALVDMYAKCGALTKAQELFDELPARDVTAWNALIAGYAQNELGDEVLSHFGRMLKEHLCPDSVTFICILKACGSVGASEKGEQIHAEVDRQGLLHKKVELGNALVDMYAKCGMLAKAQEVFNELPARNVVTWNSLIAGYAQLGKIKRVLHSFSRMMGERVEPNAVTFIVLLTACSHAGLVEEGKMYFNIMSTVYCIIPTLDHRACLVDLFSRAGHFDEAIHVIEKLPPSDCLLLWSALLGACQKWVNAELGRWAFEHAIRLDDKYTAGYVYMSNMYADTGVQEEADYVKFWGV